MKRPGWFPLILLFLAAVLIYSFLPGHARAPAGPLLIEQNGLTLRMWIAPDPAQALKMNRFHLLVTDGQRRPVPLDRVSLRLIMPTMHHDTKPVAATPLPDGSYAGDAIPLMVGSWQALFTMSVGGREVTVVYPFFAFH